MFSDTSQVIILEKFYHGHILEDESIGGSNEGTLFYRVTLLDVRILQCKYSYLTMSFDIYFIKDYKGWMVEINPTLNF